MDPMDYAARAAGAWLLGFAPVAEIYVAVPVALATGLDPASVVVWTVAGNYAPVPLVHLLYDRLMTIPRVAAWFGRLVSERFAARIDRQGMWIVLLVTPWVGVWAIAVTAKVVRLRRRALFGATFLSIALYAVALVALIELGSNSGRRDRGEGEADSPRARRPSATRACRRHLRTRSELGRCCGSSHPTPVLSRTSVVVRMTVDCGVWRLVAFEVFCLECVGDATSPFALRFVVRFVCGLFVDFADDRKGSTWSANHRAVRRSPSTRARPAFLSAFNSANT